MNAIALRSKKCVTQTTVRAYIAAYPECADEPASSPFCFCEGLELNVPLNLTASTLKELGTSIESMSNESFYLHFVASQAAGPAKQRFSICRLLENLGLNELARKIDEIDLTESTLEEAKQKVLHLISADPENC
jgi:hypothetical protein